MQHIEERLHQSNMAFGVSKKVSELLKSKTLDMKQDEIQPLYIGLLVSQGEISSL